MTLRKKLILSDLLMVVLPVALILAVWTGYVHWGSGTHLKPINRSSDESDLLTEAMNILYTYEAELSELSWDLVSFSGEDGRDMILSPDREQLKELSSLGYHIQAETTSGMLFSNMDESDRQILDSTGTRADGAVIWSGDSLVIQDSFQLSEDLCYLTAVYNRQRADAGVLNSLLPMYMISPSALLVLLSVSLLCIVFAAILATGWLNRSVLIPLGELKTGVKRIAQGDLDYRIAYPGRDEFGDVCSEFDRMRLQLQEAKRKQKYYEDERRDLLRGISHDLRSPLTSIKGYALGLKDGIAASEEKRRAYCDAILTRSEDLERLTESLSLLVRLESDTGILTPEKVCLDEYIRQFLSEKDSWIRTQNIRTEYRNTAPDAEVKLDIREMQRVFMNLFENTVRHRTADRSFVSITVSRAQKDVEIRFTDDGPGVGTEDLKHLFESFYRADRARTNPGKGSGLGLAVVRRIIDGQGGSVSASSEHGLSITILLPSAEREEKHEKDPDC